MLTLLFFALQVSFVPTSADPIAVVNVQRVLAESAVGKAATAKINALRADRQASLAQRQTALDATIKRGAPAADIQRLRVDLQRMLEDAEAEVDDMAKSVQRDFEKRLRPILQHILEEDRLGLIVEIPNPLVVWSHPSVDVTSKVITRLDAPDEPNK